MGSLQYQPLQLDRVRPHALVADADKSIAMSFDKGVVRRLGTGLYLDDNELLAVLFVKREVNLRHGVHLNLDRLADELGVTLRNCQWLAREGLGKGSQLPYYRDTV